jgi:hypothetical protein
LQELRASRGSPVSLWQKYRVLLIAGGLAVATVLFGFFGLPPILRAQAVQRLSAQLGRAVTVERVRVNPLVLSVTVEGLAVAEAAPAEGAFFGWRRFYANLDSWSLLTGRLRFQEIALDGLRAQVAKRADGGMNFDDIVARFAGAATPAGTEAEKAATKPPALAIGRFEVTDARVGFTDGSRSLPYAAEVGPISFLLEEFHTVGDPNSPYRFEAVTAAGERLAWKGTISADPVKSKGELVLENIDLARLAPYYQDLRTGELRSAFLDLTGEYALELKDGAPALRLANGALTLREVRFGAPGVAEDGLTVRRVAISGVNSDSTTLHAEIAKVAVEGVRIKAARDEGGMDLERLFAPTRPAGQRPIENAAVAVAAAYPAVKLGELAVSDVQVDLIDLTTPRRAEHRIDDLSLAVRGLDSKRLDQALPLELVVTLPAEGRIVVAGTLAAQPLAADLELTMERVGFAGLSPYLEPFINARLAAGTVRAKGQATLRDGAAAYTGDFGVAGFASVDGKLAEDFVKWTELAMTGIRATTSPLAFHADEIRLVEPSAAVRIEADGTLGIAQALGAGPAATLATATAETAPAAVAFPAAPPAPEPAFPLAVDVGRFVFEKAAFRFEDRSIRPVARGGISDFSGDITGLTSEALGRADVVLRGKVDGLAPVSITGKLNPLGRPAFVDLAVDMRGIDLQPGAGPYVGKFAGRTLTRGNLTLAVKARLDDRKVDLDNVVTLDQFYLGEPTNSPEATKLPVGLALSLLRDTSGRIVIDLPVRGSLDDPNFRIGRMVVRVLGNILVKAATSPFSLLGAAFGGGGDELGYQDFAAGSVALDEAAVQKLTTVAKALAARPGLRVDVVGAYDPIADGRALRLARLDRELRSAAWEARRQVDANTPPPELLEMTSELRAGMLAKLYAAAFPEPVGGTVPAMAAEARPMEEAVNPLTAPISTGAAGGGLRRQFGPRSRFYVRGENWTRPGPTVAFEPGKTAPAAAVGPAATTEPAPFASDATPTISETEMEARLAERIEILDGELEAVGAGRAQAIRTWLLESGRVPAERIFLAPVAGSGARVNLNLK